MALAGGTTPKGVYELLGSEAFSKRVEWSQVYLFFGDERCVSPDHPESNYAMAREALISKVPIPAENVQRIKGEVSPEEAAAEYERQLRAFFRGCEWPQFDLVLLGMGEDGHSASLFPGSPALNETSRWVLATRNENAGQDRITLTLPVFNHAAHAVFLVSGEKKAQRLFEVLHPKKSQEQFPAQLINPVNGELEWLVDAAAASRLRT